MLIGEIASSCLLAMTAPIGAALIMREQSYYLYLPYNPIINKVIAVFIIAVEDIQSGKFAESR